MFSFLDFVTVLLRLWLGAAAILAGLLAVTGLTAGTIAGTQLAACACAVVIAPFGALYAWRSA